MTEEHQTEHHEYLEEERVPEHSGTNHSMAIGFYISGIVMIFGVTLVLVGILTPEQQTEGDLGFNVNLWWGLVMVGMRHPGVDPRVASPPRRQGGPKPRVGSLRGRFAKRPYRSSATTTWTPVSSISRSVSLSAAPSVTKTSTRERGAIFASARTPSLE